MKENDIPKIMALTSELTESYGRQRECYMNLMTLCIKHLENEPMGRRAYRSKEDEQLRLREEKKELLMCIKALVVRNK